MSDLVTRPPAPLPAIPRTSTWCSRAILRTSGESRIARDSAADQGLPAGGVVVGCAGGIRTGGRGDSPGPLGAAGAVTSVAGLASGFGAGGGGGAVAAGAGAAAGS